jgi:hypothetical protein
MADIEIVRETANGFSHQGHSVFYTDSYVKLRRSFRKHALRLLRGAPLSCFMEIALADEPSDVQTICANTGYTSTATVCAAIDFLVERNFIEEIGRTGPNGVKRYRAINYAWSGSDRNAPQDVVEEPSRISKNEIRLCAPQTKIRRAKSEIRPVHDMNDDVLIKHEHSEETSSCIAEVAKILSRAFDGVNVQRLAGRIDSTELAEEWVTWCSDDESKRQFRNPQGIAYGKLMATRNARPKFMHRAEERARRPVISGKLANEILHRAVKN